MNTKKRADHNRNEEDVTIAHRIEKHQAPARSVKSLCVDSIRLKLFCLNVHANARHELIELAFSKYSLKRVPIVCFKKISISMGRRLEKNYSFCELCFLSLFRP